MPTMEERFEEHTLPKKTLKLTLLPPENQWFGRQLSIWVSAYLQSCVPKSREGRLSGVPWQNLETLPSPGLKNET